MCAGTHVEINRSTVQIGSPRNLIRAIVTIWHIDNEHSIVANILQNEFTLSHFRKLVQYIWFLWISLYVCVCVSVLSTHTHLYKNAAFFSWFCTRCANVSKRPHPPNRPHTHHHGHKLCIKRASLMISDAINYFPQHLYSVPYTDVHRNYCFIYVFIYFYLNC